MTEQKQFNGIAPFFFVQSLSQSLDYYCDTLGFERPKLWGDPPTFAMPHRDNFIIMLKQVSEGQTIATNGSQGNWDAYVWIEDADILYKEVKDRGATIDYEPCIQSEYDMKEFAVVDPDGYLIAFGEHVQQS